MQVIDDPNDSSLTPSTHKRGNSPDMMSQPPSGPPTLSPLIGFTIADNLKSKNPTELLHDMPVVIEVNEFTDESVKKFDAEMARAMRTGQTAIPILIDSYGGYVYSLFRMLDTIRSVQTRGFQVCTVAVGKAMSCGSVLLAAGDHRYAGEDAVIMIHDVSGFTFGKLPDIVADAKHTEYLGTRLFAILDKACRQATGYWAKRVHDNSHADLYLTAEEAQRSGLINVVGIPQLNVTIGVDFGFTI